MVFASFLKNLAFEGSYRIWFGEESKTLIDYDNFRNRFGSDDGIVISFKDENGVFNKKALGIISDITDALWQTKYIARVDSLSNYQDIHSDIEYADEIIVEDFISDVDSLTQESLKFLKQKALSDDGLVGNMISSDAKTVAIIASLTPKAGENEDISMKLRADIRAIVAKYSDSGYTFYLNGGAIMTTSFVDIAMDDGATFTGLTFLSVVLMLFVLYRRVSAVIIPMSIVIFTIILVLSVQVLLGFKLNNFTANMPVFIIAIGIAHSVHIYSVWMLSLGAGIGHYEAIKIAMSKNIKPIFYTSLTTAIGFASLSISDNVPIKTLGIATSSASLVAFALTMILVPSMLALIKPKNIKIDNNKNIDSTPSYAKIYSSFIINNDKKIISFSLILFLFFAIGLSKIEVDSELIKYFKPHHPLRVSTSFLSDNLRGPMSFQVVVDSKISDGALEPEFLKLVEKFEKEYKDEFSDIRYTYSLNKVIKKFNKVMNGEKNEFYIIPDNADLIAQYILLYSLSLPQGMEINDKIDISKRYYRVNCSTNVVKSTHNIAMMNWARQWWSDTKYSADVYGQTAMFATMQKDVTDTLIKSITIAIVLISIMMIFIFKDIKLLGMFLLPNILPIVLVIGIMGWLGILIDMGVAVSGAIILGVAVDDTIHFFIKYLDARKDGKSLAQALEYVIVFAGGAIIFTTVILSVAFATLLGSEFVPNNNFAITTASALIIAVITDLLLLPAMFSVSEKTDKGFKK